MENWSIRNVQCVASHCIIYWSGSIYYKEQQVLRLSFTGNQLLKTYAVENPHDFERMLETHCGGKKQAERWIEQCFFSGKALQAEEERASGKRVEMAYMG